MQLPPLDSLVKQIGADSAAIMIPNIAEQYLLCHDSFNMPKVWVDIRNSFDENIKGGNVEVYKTGTAAITNNLRITLKGHFIESVMIVPIKEKGKTVAVLEVIHDKKGKEFNNQDLQKALEFTSQIEI